MPTQHALAAGPPKHECTDGCHGTENANFASCCRAFRSGSLLASFFSVWRHRQDATVWSTDRQPTVAAWTSSCSIVCRHQEGSGNLNSHQKSRSAGTELAFCNTDGKSISSLKPIRRASKSSLHFFVKQGVI